MKELLISLGVVALLAFALANFIYGMTHLWLYWRGWRKYSMAFRPWMRGWVKNGELTAYHVWEALKRELNGP